MIYSTDDYPPPPQKKKVRPKPCCGTQRGGSVVSTNGNKCCPLALQNAANARSALFPLPTIAGSFPSRWFFFTQDLQLDSNESSQTGASTFQLSAGGRPDSFRGPFVVSLPAVRPGNLRTVGFTPSIGMPAATGPAREA